jgi:methylenetetrahydrofolate--tRNA-(uracil-5-)-methyltransferase
LGHITGGGDAASYQPMNVNFGLFPPIDTPKGAEKPQVNKKVRGKMRKAAIAERALEGLAEWLREDPPRA